MIAGRFIQLSEMVFVLKKITLIRKLKLGFRFSLRLVMFFDVAMGRKNF
jgi:hypothetical protein